MDSVPRLAGIAPSVLSRARAILRLLEGGHSANAAPSSGSRPSTGEQQLPLFAPSAPRPAVERLRQLDVDNLTPLQALQILAELHRDASGRP